MREGYLARTESMLEPPGRVPVGIRRAASRRQSARLRERSMRCCRPRAKFSIAPAPALR